MPTSESISTARACACARVMPRWISRGSVSWRPTVSTGFSEVIGSWKIMPISRPRTLRISSSGSARRFRPLKRISPSTMRPAGADTSRITESALTDLPQPDSPTSATVSPLRTFHDTPSTARTTPALVWNWVRRPRTSRRTSMSGGESTTPPATVSGSAAGPAPRRPAGRCGTCRSPASGPIRARAGTSPRAARAEPWVQVSGVTRPPACFWMRSSPTAEAAARASSTSPSSRSRRSLVECAQTPARQSACSSSRTDSALAAIGAGLLAARTCSVRPSRCWTWWPISWAST